MASRNQVKGKNKRGSMPCRCLWGNWAALACVWFVAMAGSALQAEQAAGSVASNADNLAGILTSQSLELDRGLSASLDAMAEKTQKIVATWPKEANPGEADKVHKKLLEGWDSQATAIGESLETLLLSADQKILAQLASSPQLEGGLSQQMRSSREEMSTALSEGLKSGRSEIEALTRDSTSDQASAAVQSALTKARKEIVKAISTNLGARSKALIASTQGALSLDIAREKVLQEKFKDDDDAEFLKQFNRETGLSKVVRCSWMDVPKRLRCLPDALLISADDISEIHIYDLPVGKKVTVKAFTGVDKFAKGPCTKKRGDPPNRLTCDEREINTDQGREAVIAVYKNRTFFPLYGSSWYGMGTTIKAQSSMRQDDREKLSILVSGSSQEIFLNVAVEGEPSEDTVRSGSVPIAYKRWGFEGGAFFAFTTGTDQELVTEPGENGQVKVVRKADSDNYSQQTGIFLSVFPRNYPSLGFGLGFHTDSSRATSVYFGPTLRLRSLGEQGLVTFSAGLSSIPLRRFPGVEEGKSYDAGSTALQGRLETTVRPYVLINLGFSFGPVNNNAQAAR